MLVANSQIKFSYAGLARDTSSLKVGIIRFFDKIISRAANIGMLCLNSTLESVELAGCVEECFKDNP